MFKKLGRKCSVVALAIGLFLSSANGLVAKAYTSDQVTLSIYKPGAGYVNTQSTALNVREYPSTTARVVASLPKDSMIMIVERGSDFYKVQYDAAGHYGYVASSYIREYDLEYYCQVTASDALYVRADADESAGILASIPSGDFVPILVEMSEFNYVLYGNVDGYVSRDYVFRIHY